MCFENYLFVLTLDYPTYCPDIVHLVLSVFEANHTLKHTLGIEIG